MKKKFLSLFILFCFIIMMTIGCGNISDKVDNTEEERKTEEVVSTGELQQESSSNETVLTKETEITNEDFKRMCGFVKESVLINYLDKNDISPVDFNWPESNASCWNYLQNIVDKYYFSYSFNPGSLFEFDETTDYATASEKELMEAAFMGVLDWLKEKGDYDGSYFLNAINKFFPYNVGFSENVVFH